MPRYLCHNYFSGSRSKEQGQPKSAHPSMSSSELAHPVHNISSRILYDVEKLCCIVQGIKLSTEVRNSEMFHNSFGFCFDEIHIRKTHIF